MLSFGALKAFDLVKDHETRQSKWCSSQEQFAYYCAVVIGALKAFGMV